MLTSNLEFLQIAIVLGAVEEQASLSLWTLDKTVGAKQLLHHTSLPEAHSSTISKAIAMQ